MKPDALRTLGWVIPMLCMGVAGWTLYKHNRDLTAAATARDQAQRTLENLAKELKVQQGTPPGNRFAAADDLPLEETAFLNYLRTRFGANGVTLDTWSSLSTEYGKDKSTALKDERTIALLKGIRKISSTLTLKGPYSNIRRVLGEMESTDRLYTLTNTTWNSAKDGTIVTLTLSRYVAPAAPVRPVKKITPSVGITVKP